LFRDGLFERSHACVVEYLKVNYIKKHVLDVSYVNWLDSLRIERHESLYGLDVIDVSKDEAEDALGKAMKFVKKVADLINKSKKSSTS
jgi:uncharacterized protein (UPF0332 family)